MLNKLNTLYEDLSLLDACINQMNSNLGFIKRCRECINTSANNSDLYEDYVRLAKGETAQLLEKISELFISVVENEDALYVFPKNLLYTAAISFVIEDYANSGDIESAISSYNQNYELLSNTNIGYEDICETIVESQKNAIARGEFIKSTMKDGDSYSVLIPEITLLKYGNTSNELPSDLPEPPQEKKETEVTFKSILNLLKGDRNQ